jgi:hypothetical protein
MAELCRPFHQFSVAGVGSCAVVHKAHTATTMANVEVLPLVSVLLSAYTLYIVFVSASACCEIAFDTHNSSLLHSASIYSSGTSGASYTTNHLTSLTRLMFPVNGLLLCYLAMWMGNGCSKCRRDSLLTSMDQLL